MKDLKDLTQKSEEVLKETELKIETDVSDKNLKQPLFKKMFGEFRVIGLVGAKNQGKTNNIMAAILDFRKYNKDCDIYYYNLEDTLVKWMNDNIHNTYEISSLDQLSNKQNSLIIIDEFQKLSLNNRRYKELLNSVIDFIYHNNNWVLFSTPDTREFNTIIGSKIERWIIKSVKLRDCINGSQLKTVIQNYKGRFKSINDIVIPADKAIIINDDYEEILVFDYLKEVDTKLGLIDIFNVKKLPANLFSKLSEK